MPWSSRDDDDPNILRGRATLGSAVRRARLRRGLSQRQLGWMVGFDQTTISRLETAKLRGMRFKMLVRLIGILGSPDEFEIRPGSTPPPAPSRRLPGQGDGTVNACPVAIVPPSYDVDGHGLEDTAIDGEIRAYEGPIELARTG